MPPSLTLPTPRLRSGRGGGTGGRAAALRPLELVDRPHRPGGVETAEHGVGQLGELGDLPAVSGSMTCSRTVATWPGAAARTVAHPTSVSVTLVARPSVGQGYLSTSPRMGEASYDVRETRQGGVGRASQLGHPQRAQRGLREHRQHVVLELGEAGVATDLGVQHTGQQLEDGGQAQPPRAVDAVRPPGRRRRRRPRRSDRGAQSIGE